MGFVLLKTLCVIFIGFINSLFIYPRTENKSPVILVPGDGGSQAYCEPKAGGDAFLLWINLRYFLTPGTFSQYFGLKFDPETRNLTDAEYCNIHFPGWGDTSTIENLDTYKHSGTVYFELLVAALTKDPFFVSNKTLRGAPFDFRKSPGQNPWFVNRLRLLVEETYQNAGGRRVVLVGHSLGSLYSLYFLNAVPDSWKKKYIRTFLSVSGPLGGSVKALKLEASGENFGIYIRSPLSFRPAQRSMPSSAFLLPDSRLWPPTEPLIITPKVNYSAHDMERFFNDIGFPEGYIFYETTKKEVDGFIGPTGVDEVYCIYGSNLPTTYYLLYSEAGWFQPEFPDQYPTLVPGNGDGTVPSRSLQLCRRWNGAKSLIFDGAEHLRIVGDSRFVNLLKQITGFQDPSSV